MGDESVVRTCSNACYFECGHLVHVRDGKVVKIEGDPEHPFNQGYICPRCSNYTQLLYHPDRVIYPRKKVDGEWQRISWDEALDTIASKFLEIREKYGPLAISAGIDGRPQTWQTVLWARALGSPNIFACTDLCEGPAIVGDGVTVGELITQMAEPEWELSKCTLLWGANPFVTHRPYWNDMEKSRANGGKLIAIDPRRTETAERADIWLPIRPGTDGALALGMLNVIINEDLYDHDFVDKWTVGFDRLKERVQEYPVEKVSQITWISEEDIRRVARMYATAKPAILYSRNGVTQKVNATQTARGHTIMVAITGNIDIPGGNPLGRRFPGLISRGQLIHDKQFRLPREVEENAIGFKKVPLCYEYVAVSHNQSVVHSMLYGEPYRIRAMFLTGTNPVLSSPDSRLVWKALQKLEFFVVSDFFMTPTAELADIVLPAATWLERDDIGTEYSQKCMSVRQKCIEPVGECWEDAKMIIELAKRLPSRHPIPWNSVQEFNDFRLKGTGMTFEEFKKVGIVRFEQQFKIYEQRGFKTPSGKVELYSSVFEKHGYDPLPNFREQPDSVITAPELAQKYPLTLLTGMRTKAFWHSDGRQIPWARKMIPDPLIEINSEDATARGIADGDWVWLESTKNRRIQMRAKVHDRIMKGVVAAQHSWWFPEQPAPEHGCFQSNVNVLTLNDQNWDPISGTPTFKVILCEVHRMEEQPEQ